MNRIGTCHSSFLAFDLKKMVLCHSLNKSDFVTYENLDGQILLSAHGSRLCYNDGAGFYLGNVQSGFEIMRKNDNTVTLSVGRRFLSARPCGDITFVYRPQKWEEFTINGNHHMDPTICGFVEYMDLQGAVLKLACCCGKYNYGTSWFCTDISENAENRIYMMDISKRFPFPDRMFNFIFIEHGLEHVDFNGVMNFITESHRVLVDNGILRVASPSLDNWVKFYVVNDDDTDKITDISITKYNHVAAVLGIKSKALAFNTMMRNFGHKCVLDFVTYKQLLLKSGFVNVTKERLNVSRWPELNNMERRNDFFSNFETLVLEARK